MTIRVDRNLTAALSASAWTALVNLAAIPLYVRYLGMEGYGLIGFLATTQALVQILDLGLSTTINREVARRLSTGRLTEARALLSTVEVIYWGLAVAIGTTFLLLAPLIAESWLSAEHLKTQNVTVAVGLIGLVIACRWPGHLYQSALMGAQRHVISSAINAALVTLAAGGALLILAVVSPTVEAFFAWQAFAALVYVVVVRGAGWRVLGRAERRFDRRMLEPIWRFSAGVAAINVTGIALAHVDKLLLSRLLALQEFGQYMLAFAVASVLYLFSVPIYNVLYPRFSALVQVGDRARLSDTYHLSTRLSAAIVFSIGMFLSVFAVDLVQVWTGEATVAQDVAALMPMLAIGVALHGVMHVPYALQLAYGMTRLPLAINGVLMLVSLPLVIVLANVYGATGGAWAWLVFQLLYLLLGTWLTHRTLLRGQGLRWLVQDVGIPSAIALSAGLMANGLIPSSVAGAWFRIGQGAVLTFATFALTVATSRALRVVLAQRVHEWARRTV